MDHGSTQSKLFTRGGQITFNNIRMFMQVSQKITHWTILLTLITLITTLWVISSLDSLKATYYYTLSFILIKLSLPHYTFHILYHGKELHVNAIGVLNEYYFKNQVSIFLQNLKVSFYLTFSISFTVVSSVTLWLIRRGQQQVEERFIRGSRIESPDKVAKAIKKYGASDIKIASVPMVKDFEVKHVLIHGTTGAGKGQTFNQFIEQIRQRGESAIIFDKGCVFTSLFYNETTDIILNPFDQRCVHWNLWEESKSLPDFENMAESLIPEPQGATDPFWANSARTILSSIIHKMSFSSHPTIEKLLYLVLTADLKELENYLKDTAAASLVSHKIEKTTLSIRSTMATYSKSLRCLRKIEGEPFSIRRWIKTVADKKESHFLFISSNAEQHASLKPLISMWLSIASIALLSLEENYDRRIWFICDELPALHKLPNLGGTIAEVRKFGGCFILGMQSFSQLEKIYGRAGALEIFDLLNTRFFFRSPSADMAALVSKELGQEDLEQSNESYSYGTNIIRDGITVGTQRGTRPLVTPSEIMELPNLIAYLRVPAPIPITKLEIPYKKREKINSGFILREMDFLQELSNQESEGKYETDSLKGDNRTKISGIYEKEQDLVDVTFNPEKLDNNKFEKIQIITRGGKKICLIKKKT